MSIAFIAGHEKKMSSLMRSDKNMENILKTFTENNPSLNPDLNKGISKNEFDEIFGRQVGDDHGKESLKLMIVEKGNEDYIKLLECLGDFNKKWAAEASYLGVVFIEETQKSILNNKAKYAYATNSFIAAASSKASKLGVYVHQMIGFSESKIQEDLGFHKKPKSINMFAIGRLGKIETAPFEENRTDYPDQKNERDALFLDFMGSLL